MSLTQILKRFGQITLLATLPFVYGCGGGGGGGSSPLAPTISNSVRSIKGTALLQQVNPSVKSNLDNVVAQALPVPSAKIYNFLDSSNITNSDATGNFTYTFDLNTHNQFESLSPNNTTNNNISIIVESTFNNQQFSSYRIVSVPSIEQVNIGNVELKKPGTYNVSVISDGNTNQNATDTKVWFLDPASNEPILYSFTNNGLATVNIPQGSYKVVAVRGSGDTVFKSLIINDSNLNVTDKLYFKNDPATVPVDTTVHDVTAPDTTVSATVNGNNVLITPGSLDSDVSHYNVVVDNGTLVTVNFGATYTASGLVDGVHNIFASAVDNSGNVDLSSATAQVTIDTLAPVISDVSLSDGYRTNVPTQIITYKSDGVDKSKTVNLVEGANPIDLVESDSFGNVTTKTINLILDTIGPTVDNFNPASGLVTKDGSIPVTYDLDGIVQTVNYNLVEGVNNFSVIHQDDLGNQTQINLEYIRDTIAPTIDDFVVVNPEYEPDWEFREDLSKIKTNRLRVQRFPITKGSKYHLIKDSSYDFSVDANDANNIVSYVVDWNGDGTYDETLSSKDFNHSFSEYASQTIIVKAIDDAGNESLSFSKKIIVGMNEQDGVARIEYRVKNYFYGNNFPNGALDVYFDGEESNFDVQVDVKANDDASIEYLTKENGLASDNSGLENSVNGMTEQEISNSITYYMGDVIQGNHCMPIPISTPQDIDSLVNYFGNWNASLGYYP